MRPPGIDIEEEARSLLQAHGRNRSNRNCPHSRKRRNENNDSRTIRFSNSDRDGGTSKEPEITDRMRPDGPRSGVVAFAIAFPVAVVFAFLVVIPTLSEAEGE